MKRNNNNKIKKPGVYSMVLDFSRKFGVFIFLNNITPSHRRLNLDGTPFSFVVKPFIFKTVLLILPGGRKKWLWQGRVVKLGKKNYSKDTVKAIGLYHLKEEYNRTFDYSFSLSLKRKNKAFELEIFIPKGPETELSIVSF